MRRERELKKTRKDGSWVGVTKKKKFCQTSSWSLDDLKSGFITVANSDACLRARGALSPNSIYIIEEERKDIAGSSPYQWIGDYRDSIKVRQPRHFTLGQRPKANYSQ